MFLAKVTKVDTNQSSGTDKLKFVILFSAEGIVKDALAYPLNSMDQPEVGEEVAIFELETVFGYSYLYQKLKLNEDTRLKVQGSVVDIEEDRISVKTETGDVCIKVKDGDLDIQVNGNINLKVNGSIKLVGTAFVTPTGEGPFNAIPTCPYTGLPHSGSEIQLVAT